MFDGLRKKLSEAVKVFTKKEERVIEQRQEGVVVPEPKREEPRPEQKEGIKQEEAGAESPKEEKRIEPKKEHREEQIVKVSLKTKLKSIISSSVYINDDEIDSLLENIKVPLLESDVSYDTTEAFLESLRANLKQTKVDSKNINKELVELVRKSLFEVLSKSGRGTNVTEFVKERLSSGNAPVKMAKLTS